MADRVQDVREALVAVLRADPAVQAAAGRATRLVAPDDTWDTLPRPCLTYVVVVGDTLGGTGRPLLVTVQLTAWAEGDDSTAVAALLLDAAVTALSAGAFLAQGLNASVGRQLRRTVPVDAQGARQLARQDVDLDLTVRLSLSGAGV